MMPYPANSTKGDSARGDHRHRRTSASTMPTACQRVTRSRSTTIASSTVAAGYSAISTPASDSIEDCSASSIATLATGVEHRGGNASRSGTPRSAPRRLAVIAAATPARSRSPPAGANTSGHSLASTGTWSSSTKFSPNATPEPTVSQATFAVNWCGVTSSSVASRLTSTTATSASSDADDRDGAGPLPQRQADADRDTRHQDRRQR